MQLRPINFSVLAIPSLCSVYVACSIPALAADDVAAGASTVDTRTRVQKEPGTHIHIPLINIDVDKGPSGVHVKVPFVRVDKDASDGALDVKAPFVRVQKDDANSPARVDAPFTHVNGVKKEKVVDPPAQKIGEAENVPRMQADPQKASAPAPATAPAQSAVIQNPKTAATAVPKTAATPVPKTAVTPAQQSVKKQTASTNSIKSVPVKIATPPAVPQ